MTSPSLQVGRGKVASGTGVANLGSAGLLPAGASFATVQFEGRLLSPRENGTSQPCGTNRIEPATDGWSLMRQKRMAHDFNPSDTGTRSRRGKCLTGNGSS